MPLAISGRAGSDIIGFVSAGLREGSPENAPEASTRTTAAPPPAAKPGPSQPEPAPTLPANPAGTGFVVQIGAFASATAASSRATFWRVE